MSQLKRGLMLLKRISVSLKTSSTHTHTTNTYHTTNTHTTHTNTHTPQDIHTHPIHHQHTHTPHHPHKHTIHTISYTYPYLLSPGKEHRIDSWLEVRDQIENLVTAEGQVRKSYFSYPARTQSTYDRPLIVHSRQYKYLLIEWLTMSIPKIATWPWGGLFPSTGNKVS